MTREVGSLNRQMRPTEFCLTAGRMRGAIGKEGIEIR
jgi:hypothetical protein